MNVWWLLNTYIWGLCAVAWAWIGYMLYEPRALLVSLACLGLMLACNRFVEPKRD